MIQIQQNQFLFLLNQTNHSAFVIDYIGSIENITIPSSINYEEQNYSIFKIGENAFKNKCIKSVIFEENSKLEIIDDFAFYNSQLEKISIPPSLKRIGHNAFDSCWKLECVELPENSDLCFIGEKSFYNCIFEKITIPANVEFVGNGWSFYNDHLKEVYISPNNKHFICQNNLILYRENDISDKYDTIFFAHRDIEKVEIPSNIKRIYKCAFKNCHKLRSVTFAENIRLSQIDDYAFCNTAIRAIKIPKSIKKIGMNAFYNCSCLSKVEFEENSELCIIDNCAFHSTSISSIKIPLFVQTINNSAFYNCCKLESVEFEQNSQLNAICGHAFHSTSISSIKIPAHVQIIGYQAFDSCTKLKNLEFDSNSELNTIDGHAFQSSSIEKLIIPSNVKKIEPYAFDNCKQLVKIDFEEISELGYIGSNAFSKTSIERITIPSKVYIIGSSAFSECQQLRSIEFEECSSLQIIESNVFSSTSINSIRIPSCVQLIKKYAFCQCKELNSIEFDDNSNLQYIEDDAFQHSALATIHITSHFNLINYCFSYCQNLVEFKVSPMNKHFKFTDDGLLLYKSDENGIEYDFLFHASKNIIHAHIPASVKRIDKNAFKFCKQLKYFEIDANSQIKCIDSNMLFEYLPEIIIAPSKLIRCLSYIQKMVEMTQLVINDEDVHISNDMFYGIPNIKRISLPNALHIKIGNINQNLKIFVNENATIDDYESARKEHKITKVEKELLNNIWFPSKDDRITFLQKTISDLKDIINQK